MSLQDNIDRVGEQLQGALAGMTDRDRALLAMMLVGVLGMVGYLGWSSMDKRMRRLESTITEVRLAQEQVNALMGGYLELEGQVAAMDAKLAAGANFAIASWLEQIGNEMAISEKVKSINERGSSETDYYRSQQVDMVVDDLTLSQVVDLMYRLENEPIAIRLKEVRVKPDRKDRALLDVRLQLAVLKPLGAS